MGQSISQGSPAGFLGGLAGAAGGMSGLGGIGKLAETAQGALKTGAAGASVIEGALRGDLGQLLGGLNGVAGKNGPLGELSRLADGRLAGAIGDAGSKLASVAEPLRQAVTQPVVAAMDQVAARMLPQGPMLPGVLRAAGATGLADRLDDFAASPAAQAFRQTTERAGQLLGALGQRQPAPVGDVLRQWMPELAAGTASGAVEGLSAEARRLLESPEMAEAQAVAEGMALEARHTLEYLAGLDHEAFKLRRFEESAREMQVRWNSDWQAMGSELLQGYNL
jgi:hypothetical protein